MSNGQHKSALLDTLHQLRKRLRWLLAFDGIARLFTAGLLLTLFSLCLDWWVHLPGLLRGTALILGLATIWQWGRRRIWAPLVEPIPLHEIAARLDAHFPQLGRRLSSAVDHIEHHADGADELWDRVLDETLTAANSVPWHAALSARRTIRSALTALICAAAFYALTFAWPTLFDVGLRRFFTPLASVQWPADVVIEPITGDVTVAIGEPVTLSMHLLRGGSSRTRGILVIKEKGSPERRERMLRNSDGVYTCTITHPRQDGVYWFEAGDGTTAEHPHLISVAARPRVVDASASIAPPTYASTITATNTSLDRTTTTALQGSRVTITLHLDKAADTAREPPHFEGPNSEYIPGVATGDDNNVWTAEFTLTGIHDLTFRFVDRDGLIPAVAPRYRFEATTDRNAEPYITAPRDMLEATPLATLDLLGGARDDVGLLSVDLVFRAVGNDNATHVSLWIAADEPDAPHHEVIIDHGWALENHHWHAGTIIEYWLEAQDNYNLDGTMHEPARTPIRRLQIVSPAVLLDRYREASAALAKRLRLIQRNQTAVLDETVRALTELKPLNERGMRQQAAAQRAVGNATHDIERAVRELAGMLDSNAHPDVAMTKQLELLADSLSRARNEEMSPSADGLEQIARNVADGQTNPAAQANHDELELIRGQQQRALAALQQIMDAIEASGDYTALVRRLQSMLDEQELLTRDTSAATGDLSGKEIAALSSTEVEALTRLSKRQTALRGELGELTDRMQDVARSMGPDDAAAAESLRGAATALQQESVAAHMEDAAQSITENLGLRAEAGQYAAAAGIRQALQQMAERAKRELEMLSRNLTAAGEKLQKLIDAQDELVGRIRAASESDDAATAMASLVNRQNTLRSTTGRLAQQLTTELATAAAKVIGHMTNASDLMTLTSDSLDAADAQAMVHAVNAADELRAALAAIADAKQDADQQLAQQALDEFRKRLTQIRDNETKLALELRTMLESRQESDPLTRAERIMLVGHADTQRGILDEFTAVRRESADAVVVDFVLQSIADAMSQTIEQLDAADPALAFESLAALVEELTQLLAVLEQSPAANSRFVNTSANSGGSGEGASQKPAPLVPPLAELKLLRIMQARLASDTRDFNDTASPRLIRDEPQKRKADALARRQQRLFELARQMLQKAEASQ